MNTLTEKILNYESDTFSASAMEVDEEEAEALAEAVMNDLFDHYIDGLGLSEYLEDLRTYMK